MKNRIKKEKRSKISILRRKNEFKKEKTGKISILGLVKEV